MSRRRHDVLLHLDRVSGAWWGQCAECHWYGAGSTMMEVRELARQVHRTTPRWDLVVDNTLALENSASVTEFKVDWTMRP